MSGKKYTDALKGFDREQFYTPTEALGIVKTVAKGGFDESVDVSVRLGVDPRKADQMVRGTVALPSGTGKDVRVAVFAAGEAAAEAREAGADLVGADDLAAQVEAGKFDFDVAIATPDMMPLVGRLGRALGPRGLMPNPKTGTVTNDVGRAVTEFKGGKVEYRTDRYGNVHVPLGKVSFEPDGAGDELPRRARRAAAGQAGVGQGPLPAQDHGLVDDGPRRPRRHRPPAPRRVVRRASVSDTSSSRSSATNSTENAQRCRSRAKRSRLATTTATSSRLCWTDSVHCSIFPHGGRNTPPLCWYSQWPCPYRAS